jgi:hypothetical protein
MNLIGSLRGRHGKAFFIYHEIPERHEKKIGTERKTKDIALILNGLR